MVLHHEGNGINEIARRIGRDNSTISREIERSHLWKYVYIASRAQEMYESRRVPCRRHHRLEDPELFMIVREKFLDHRWSLEQISNRLAKERLDLSVSTSTINRAIYKHLLEYDKYSYGKGLASKLRHKGKRRRRSSENESRGKIRISNDLSVSDHVNQPIPTLVCCLGLMRLRLSREAVSFADIRPRTSPERTWSLF